MFKHSWFLYHLWLSVVMAPLIWNGCFWVSKFSLCSQIHLECHRFQEPFPASAFTDQLCFFLLRAPSLTVEANTGNAVLIVKVCEMLTLCQVLPNALHGLNHRLLSIALWDTYYHHHFTNWGVKKLRNLPSSGHATGQWQTRLGTQAA